MCMCNTKGRLARLFGGVTTAALVMLGIGLAAQTSTTTSSAPQAASRRRTSAPSPAPQGPSLGVAVSADDIAAMDVSIGPDGAGLPPGSGTPKQGAEVYATKCMACHGPEGANGMNDRLVGGKARSPAPHQ